MKLFLLCRLANVIQETIITGERSDDLVHTAVHIIEQSLLHCSVRDIRGFWYKS